MKENRNASALLTIEFDKIESDKYSDVTKLLVNSFNLEKSSDLTIGLNEIFQDYKLGNHTVGLEWDIWSGYIVTARNIESEILAKKLATRINEQKK